MVSKIIAFNFVTLSLIFFGCGQEEDDSVKTIDEFSCSTKVVKSSDIISKIDRLQQNVNNFIGEYSSKFNSFDFENISSINLEWVDRSAEDPIIINEKKLWLFYRDIILDLRTDYDQISEIIIDDDWTQEILFLSDYNISRLRNIFGKISKISEKASRWVFSYCDTTKSYKNRKNDIRMHPNYYSMGIDVVYNNNNNNNNDNDHQFYVNFRKTFGVAFFNYFFSTRRDGNRFKCYKKQSHTTIQIPVIRSPYKVINEALVSAVRNYWTHERVLIQLFYVQPSFKGQALEVIVDNRVRVAHVPVYESFKINIPENLLYSNNLEMILAHEFGHTMKFYDCYIEYFDKVKSEVVYYELNSNNLMCSLHKNASIPSHYFYQLIKYRCI